MQLEKKNSCLYAFTLAEVLITLGIIGVVASMTIPTLISSYRKNVVIIRMQKFYSIMNQAVRASEVDNGPTTSWTYGGLYDYPSNQQFYDTYLKNYLKVEKVENKTEALPVLGVKLYLEDGSAVTVSSNWLIYAPVANKTDEYGRDLFIFMIRSDTTMDAYSACNNTVYPLGCGLSRNSLRSPGANSCTETPTAQRRYCAAMIMRDNWQIASDYPIGF